MSYAHKLRTLLKNSNNYQRSPVSSVFLYGCMCVYVCVCTHAVCVCVCTCVHLCVFLHEGPKVTAPLPRTSWPCSVLPH